MSKNYITKKTTSNEDLHPTLKKEDFEDARDLSTIKPYIEKAADLLGIEAPEIKTYPFLAETKEGYLTLREYDPRIEGYIMGCLIGVENLIEVATHNALFYYLHHINKGDAIERYQSLNCTAQMRDEELLFTILHEMRHRFQFLQEPQAYLASFSEKNDSSDDPFEVDADAFAAAFMHKFTNYNQKNYMAEMWSQMQHDKGARKACLRKLKKRLK